MSAGGGPEARTPQTPDQTEAITMFELHVHEQAEDGIGGTGVLTKRPIVATGPRPPR